MMDTRKWLGALTAAALFAAGSAVAQDDMDVRGSATTGSETQDGAEVSLEPSDSLVPEADVDADFDVQTERSEAWGGSGQAGTEVNPAVTTTAVDTDWEEEKSEPDMRGLTLNLGGGVEGYTGNLGDQIEAGGAWGVNAIIRPSKVFGIELGYSGAAHELGADGWTNDSSELATGPDLIRNGAHAVATLGLNAAAVQPYALAGLGVSRYTVRGNTDAFSDDWSGSLPVGAGIRTHVGNFTADLRGTYSMMFDQDVAANPGAENSFFGEDFLTAGRWAGTLNIGTTW